MIKTALDVIENNKKLGKNNISIWMPGCLIHCWNGRGGKA